MNSIFFLIPVLLLFSSIPLVYADTYEEVVSFDVWLFDDGNNDICDGDSLGSLSSADLYYGVPFESAPTDCNRSWLEWNISQIPFNAVVTNVVFKFDVVAVDPSVGNCDFTPMVNKPSTATTAAQWTDIGDGTPYVSNDSECATAGDNKSITLGSVANADLTAALHDERGWFAIGMKATLEPPPDVGSTKNGLIEDSEGGGTPAPTLEITYTAPPPPDAVDDLTGSGVTRNSVDLDWTVPNLNGGNVTGYQINYTTPVWGIPLTILTNDTQTTDVTSLITSLASLQNYSFSVGIWTESKNMSGNFINITTLEDFTPVNFTTGNFDFNATNDDVIQMFFERIDIDSTSTWVNVTYPNSFDLACDLSYEFAQINQTYTGLDETVITASTVESSFLFQNVTNEIITIYCWDEGNLENDGLYLLTQDDFILLQQIENFRNGTYGTAGQIGALDFITMLVIIFAMIGLNRYNESVGGIFGIIILGVTGYFGIIELPTVIFGAIAITLMLIITTTRKN